MLKVRKLFLSNLLSIVIIVPAEVCIWLRMYRAARRFYLLGEKILPTKKVEFLVHIGFLYERSSDLQRAVEYYREASDLEPLNCDFYWDMACAYEKMNNMELAIQNYKRALDLGTSYDKSFRDEIMRKIAMLENQRSTRG
jgi:tetratricopeptide (TPR) repeat protein